MSNKIELKKLPNETAREWSEIENLEKIVNVFETMREDEIKMTIDYLASRYGGSNGI